VGLRERLAAVDGTLQSGFAGGGLFRLVAEVPLRGYGADEPDGGDEPDQGNEGDEVREGDEADEEVVA
jgi:hypothetical protein